MRLPIFAGIALALAGCTKEAAVVKAGAPSVELAAEFSGEKAFEHVRRQVEFGPRPSGTSVLEKARGHITETLQAAGWDVERQEFDEKPVRTRERSILRISSRAFPPRERSPRLPKHSGPSSARTTIRSG